MFTHVTSSFLMGTIFLVSSIHMTLSYAVNYLNCLRNLLFLSDKWHYTACCKNRNISTFPADFCISKNCVFTSAVEFETGILKKIPVAITRRLIKTRLQINMLCHCWQALTSCCLNYLLAACGSNLFSSACDT